MGVWGPGLYSSDIAADLKSTVHAVARLPYETQKLVDIITEAFPETAGNRKDEDYTTFWLVLADQFHRCGLDNRDIFDKAIKIIDSGKDLQMARELGMGAGDLRKRAMNLNALRSKLCQPVPPKTRKTLKTPQPFLMEEGEVMIFPINEEGRCFNPYFTERARKKFPQQFTQVDWGAAVIIARGREFGFLTWYCPLVITKRLNTNEKPSLDSLKAVSGWQLFNPGTCPEIHYRRMELEKIGSVRLNAGQVKKICPKGPERLSAVVNDISIANHLAVEQNTIYMNRIIIDRLRDIST
jgi:hypothetical protein